MGQAGKIIQELRIRSGFTQKSLADALHVTDKAISKWERDICLPDTGLLPKLALLLDTDINLLIATSIDENEWVGLINIEGCDLTQTIYDKPLVYYLLSHFLLLGITNIHIITDEKNRDHLQEPRYKQLGFSFSFVLPEKKNVMMINHPWFLFGSDLTQMFQGTMLANRVVKLVPENQEPVFFFIPKDKSELIENKKLLEKKAVSKTLGRGMLAFDMGNYDKCLDVASFVRTYQMNSGMLIASLEEIAYRRGYIDENQLKELLVYAPYKSILISDAGKPQVDCF